ncbi:hypothetical protein QW131_10350 [Roseibium salinum]|nr:hypothetical protein [Roseibium salinum]
MAGYPPRDAEAENVWAPVLMETRPACRLRQGLAPSKASTADIHDLVYGQPVVKGS